MLWITLYLMFLLTWIYELISQWTGTMGTSDSNISCQKGIEAGKSCKGQCCCHSPSILLPMLAPSEKCMYWSSLCFLYFNFSSGTHSFIMENTRKKPTARYLSHLKIGCRELLFSALWVLRLKMCATKPVWIVFLFVDPSSAFLDSHYSV